MLSSGSVTLVAAVYMRRDVKKGRSFKRRNKIHKKIMIKIGYRARYELPSNAIVFNIASCKVKIQFVLRK